MPRSLYILSVLCFAFAIIKLGGTNQEINALVPLVSIDGKTYYFDSGLLRNWTATGKYCESFGLSLAAITSTREYDALHSSVAVGKFDGVFWTAGRDACTLRQFSWNTTDDAITVDLPHLTILPRSCLLFFTKLTSSYMGSYSCDMAVGKALCELKR